MRYYKVLYSIGDFNQRIYPAGVNGVVWSITQDHYSDHIMVAGTQGQSQPNGDSVTELSEQDALALIKEFKETYPKLREEDVLFPFGPIPKS